MPMTNDAEPHRPRIARLPPPAALGRPGAAVGRARRRPSPWLRPRDTAAALPHQTAAQLLVDVQPAHAARRCPAPSSRRPGSACRTCRAIGGAAARLHVAGDRLPHRCGSGTPADEAPARAARQPRPSPTSSATAATSGCGRARRTTATHYPLPAERRGGRRPPQPARPRPLDPAAGRRRGARRGRPDHEGQRRRHRLRRRPLRVRAGADAEGRPLAGRLGADRRRRETHVPAAGAGLRARRRATRRSRSASPGQLQQPDGSVFRVHPAAGRQGHRGHGAGGPAPAAGGPQAKALRRRAAPASRGGRHRLDLGAPCVHGVDLRARPRRRPPGPCSSRRTGTAPLGTGRLTDRAAPVLVGSGTAAASALSPCCSPRRPRRRRPGS